MAGPLVRGAVAGAVGTTVLQAVTYADMAARGRPASSTPQRSVDAIAARLGGRVPGSRAERDARRTALGALLGASTGVSVGVGVALARASGLRLPGPLGGLATGAAAMAAANGPMVALGVSDPRSWSAADWMADALPHLAYGFTTRATVVALERHDRDHPLPPRPSAGLILRSAALGVAAGGRSTLGLAAAQAARGGGTRLPALLVGAEVVGDKLPQTPSRLSPSGLSVRSGAGAAAGAASASAEGAAAALPVLVGAAGALVGSYAGAAWRASAGTRVPDWQAALLEDAVAVSLAVMAGRRR